MQVPRKQFFEFLTYDVYYDWTNNANSDFCFEDYYGYVKENTQGYHILRKEYLCKRKRGKKMKVIKYIVWFLLETAAIILFLAWWW